MPERADAAEGRPAGDALIVPGSLQVTALAGGNGVLELFALTLRRGAGGPELYAALRNAGDVPACHAAFAVELFDRTGESLAAGISGLLTQSFYRLEGDIDAIAACVAPRDVTMTAIMDLPADLVLEDVGHAIYRCPYFALDVEAIGGLDVARLERVEASSGARFAGTLVNGLDVAVSNPSITVFPVNRVGRPLGAATALGTVDLPPRGRWTFETSAVDEAGADQLAFPAGALAVDSSR